MLIARTRLQLFDAEGRALSVREACQRGRSFYEAVLGYGGRSVRSRAISGDEALWIPLGRRKGIKLIPSRAPGELMENLRAFQKAGLGVFPRIYAVRYLRDLECVMVECEEVPPATGRASRPAFLGPDAEFCDRHLNGSPGDLDRCVETFFRHELTVEDAWMKSHNFMGGRIVDFHRFRKKPERYRFPVNGTPVGRLEKIHREALGRYACTGKWKGRIYQGMRFDNGYEMEGFSSDGRLFDSYRKLPFIFINKARQGRVLDLGCNEGFFSFQAALHGASEVIGVDNFPEDLALAEELKIVMNLKNCRFVLGDFVDYVDRHQHERFDLIFLFSVLHLAFEHMKDCGSFLRVVSRMSRYLAFETPVNHPRMRLPLEHVWLKLNAYFERVRLLYVYDAYSSGYRAIFMCENT